MLPTVRLKEVEAAYHETALEAHRESNFWLRSLARRTVRQAQAGDVLALARLRAVEHELAHRGQAMP